MMEWVKQESAVVEEFFASGNYRIEKEDAHDYTVWFLSMPIGGASSVALAKQVAYAHAAKQEATQ